MTRTQKCKLVQTSSTEHKEMFIVYNIIAVMKHNKMCSDKPITTVLCPGLGTAVGRMPFSRCAHQMRVAYDAVVHRSVPDINCPTDLSQSCTAHVKMIRVS